MCLASTPGGDLLLEFHREDFLSVSKDIQAIPMPLALVIATYQGKTLFIFNRWRQIWELPGGIIEEGETPLEAAIRELAEETGQQVKSLTYIGWMKFLLKPDDRLERGVLYGCELETLQPFEVNHEASKLMLMDLKSSTDDTVNAIDHYLATLKP